jgi:NADP-dependent 3-hydroxy acid dehydrogenase YdfG
MLNSLEKQIVWITGAGTGIGEGAARAMAAKGASVILSGRRENELDRVRDAIRADGGTAESLPLDIADFKAVDAVLAKILDTHGRIDVLVHSAGMNITDRSWEKGTSEDFERLISVNVSGAFHCCRSVLPAMREQGGGLILAISSWAGRQPSSLAGAAYSASKHALNALCATINMEQCTNYIRATAICPGEVATPILDFRPEPPPQEDREKMLQIEDLGEVCAFLAQLPPHVCINDLLISPTWNRSFVGKTAPLPEK